MHNELTQQVTEKDKKKEAERNERKELIMTSGGPVMDAEDVEQIRQKFKAQQTLNKLNLTKQREMD